MNVKITRKGLRYLKKKFKKEGLEFNKDTVVKDIEKILEPFADKIPDGFLIKIINGDELNGHSESLVGKKAIDINGRYIVDCYVCKDKDFAKASLVECVGHELGHSKAFSRLPVFVILKAMFPILATKKDEFEAQLLELFCDNYAYQFSGFDKELVTKIMDEKINRRKKVYKDFQHPSWEEREKYIGLRFNEKFIRDFAEYKGFTDEVEINNLIDYYNKVINDDGYIRTSDLIISNIRAFYFVPLIIAFCITQIWFPF